MDFINAPYDTATRNGNNKPMRTAVMDESTLRYFDLAMSIGKPSMPAEKRFDTTGMRPETPSERVESLVKRGKARGYTRAGHNGMYARDGFRSIIQIDESDLDVRFPGEMYSNAPEAHGMRLDKNIDEVRTVT
jgi:hypothetical protein